MSIKFLENELIIGGSEWTYTPLRFYKDILKLGGGTSPSRIDIVLSGTGSLTLTNAKADGLNYLKLFGDTEQRNLPKGYTQYEYLRSTGTQYIDLGYKGNGNTKVKIKFRYHTATSETGSGRVFGSRITSQNDAFAIGTSSGIVSSEGTNKMFWCYDGQPYFIDDTNFGLDVWKTVVFSATEHTIDGVTVGDDYTLTEFETPFNLKLFGFDNNGTVGVGYVDIAFCQLWNDDVLVRDVVPAGYGTTNSMYDRVSGAMLPNAGTGNFVAGPAVVPTPDTPIDIISNNGVIKYSLNMANVNAQTALVGYYISNSGVITADANNWIYQNFIPVKPNTTYTLTMSAPVYFVTISEYSTADGSGFIRRNAGGSGDNTTLTIITGSTTNFVRFGTNIDRTEVTLEEVLAINWMLNEGNSKAYQPYAEGGIYTDGTVETVKDSLNNTATAEMLLKVGDYSDEQEVLTGTVTRNVGIKVLDGTETWTKATLNFYADIVSDAIHKTHTCFCTHYTGIISNGSVTLDSNSIKVSDNSGRDKYWNRVLIYAKRSDYATVQDFKNYLASEYAKGTPVIIVYPIATPTTETVTGQHLTVQAGTNIIEITQASIDGLPLEVSYKQQQ